MAEQLEENEYLSKALIEGIGAFLLVLTVLAVALNPKAKQEWAPWAIGITLGFLVMVFGPLTGGSFNPARWFGPALVGIELGDPADLPRLMASLESSAVHATRIPPSEAAFRYLV